MIAAVVLLALTLAGLALTLTVYGVRYGRVSGELIATKAQATDLGERLAASEATRHDAARRYDLVVKDLRSDILTLEGDLATSGNVSAARERARRLLSRAVEAPASTAPAGAVVLPLRPPPRGSSSGGPGTA